MDKASYIKNNSKWNSSLSTSGGEETMTETAEAVVKPASDNPWADVAVDIDRQESDAVAVQSAETPAFDRSQWGSLTAEIDGICSDIFAEMNVIDSSFGKLANYFRKQADIVANGRKPAYLSDDETDAAVLYELYALATSGIGKLFQAASMEIKLRNEIYPHLREVARLKLPAVERLLNQCKKMDSDDFDILAEYISEDVTADCFRAEKKEKVLVRMQLTLDNWRSSRFHLRYLEYWQKQLTDWYNDDFSTGYNMPDMEDVNWELLFGCIYRNDLADENKSLEQSCKDIRSDLEGVLSGKFTTFPMYVAVLICDDGLLATYQTHCSECYALSDISDLMSDMDVMQNEFIANKAFCDNYNLRKADVALEEESDSRAGMIFINGILLTAILAIPIFTKLSVLWSIVSTIVIGGIILWRCGAIFNKIQEKYELKQEKLRIFADTCARRVAGENPQPRKISEIVEKKNSIWIGALVGGIIGLIIPIVGGFIIGAIIGAIVASSSDEVDALSDGSDWESVETGTGVWAKVICFILVLLMGFEIYKLFIQ